MATKFVGEPCQLPGFVRLYRDRLFDEHVSARLQRCHSVLEMKACGAGHEADVDTGIDDIAVVLAGVLKAPVTADLVQHVAAFASNSDELDVVISLGEVGQV